MRLNVEVMKYIPNVPQNLLNQVIAQTEGLDISLNDRFMRKIRSKIMSHLPPLRSVTTWRQHMATTKVIFQNHEYQKKEFRQIFKRLAGNIEGIYPAGLRERALPDIANTVERMDTKTYGVDPFRHGSGQILFEKELLQYQGPYTFASFARVKVECGDVNISNPEKRVMIFSLTTMALLEEMMERGCTWEHMVKIFSDFFRQMAPDVASRINSLQEVDLKTILNTLELMIDIPDEIKTVEKSIMNIYRDPQDSIKLPGDSFQAKQRLLYDLRAIQTAERSAEELEDQESRINHVTVEFCLELVSEEVKSAILEVKMRRGMRASTLSLADFYYEVGDLERKNPSFRIKDRKHMRRYHTCLPVKIYNTEAAANDQDYEEDDDYQDARDSPEADTEPGPGPKLDNKDIFKNTRRRRPGKPGERPHDEHGGIRFDHHAHRNNRNPPVEEYCDYCGDSSHNSQGCLRYGPLVRSLCRNRVCIQINNGKPLYHNEEICRYAKDSSGSGYVTPHNRGSPECHKRHGFKELGVPLPLSETK